MKSNIVNFLKHYMPYMAVLILWRLSIGFFNPAGILCIIPIFYFTFVRHTPMFGIFGALFCFLLDYNMDIFPFWTASFLLLYATNGFQTIIDLPRMDYSAARIFMIFFGICIGILCLVHFRFANFIRYIWLYLWTCALYVPMTTFFKRVCDD